MNKKQVERMRINGRRLKKTGRENEGKEGRAEGKKKNEKRE